MAEMIVLDGSSERQHLEENSFIELIEEKISRRICSGNHQALWLTSDKNTQALVVLDHGSLPPSSEETIKFVHEFTTFGTVIPLRNVLVAHFPDANIVTVKFFKGQGSSEHYLLVVDSKGRAFLWRHALSLSLWTMVTTFSLFQEIEEDNLILAMEYEEMTSTMLWIARTNSTTATLHVFLGHIMISSSSASTNQRGVTVTSSDNKTNNNVLLIGPSVILSLPASDPQTSVLFSGCATNGIWIVMNTITSSSSPSSLSSPSAAASSSVVYFYDCSNSTLLHVSLPLLLHDSKLSFCIEDVLGSGNRYHPSIRITNESKGQPIFNVMMINEKLSIVSPNDYAGLRRMNGRDSGTGLMMAHTSLTKDDDCYALSDGYLHSLIDDEPIDDAADKTPMFPSSTINPPSSSWTVSTSSIPEISLSRSLFLEPSSKSGLEMRADSSISASMMQLISSRASEVIRHLCTSREAIATSTATSVSASGAGAVSGAASPTDATLKDQEGVCEGSWIEEIDLIYLTPSRDPSFVLCKHTNSNNYHHHSSSSSSSNQNDNHSSSSSSSSNSSSNHNDNHSNSGVLEPFELILISTLVRDMTDDSNPRQATCR